MGKVDFSNIHYVPEDVAPTISRYTVDARDLYISCAGSLGIVGQVPDILHGANLTENANRISAIQINPSYLLHVLMSEMIQGHIQNIQTVGAQPKLALGRIRSFEIPCPDDPKEQEAIAEALSDADALIEGLERLIAKKRLIKQGAMQDLLTAKRRLPGFSGEWTPCKLGERGQFFKGSGVRKDEANSGLLPCVRYGELYTLHDDVVRKFSSFISAEVAKTARPIKSGDILFAGSGETKEEIGKCAVAIFAGEMYAGGDIIALRPSADDPVFLSYLLNAPAVQKQKARKGQGDAVVHISASALGDLDLKLPSQGEQAEIAKVLEDMDAEIQALETRLEKARQVKEGMMQNLLTGRIRLV
jgi:type I restriction enzyme S subunit